MADSRAIESELELEEEFESLEGLERPEWELTPAYARTLRQNVSGFSRYSNSIAVLPAAEQAKLRNIASLIVRSYGPGGRPIRSVHLIGHADRDLARERRQPGFMAQISRQRAIAARSALQRLMRNNAILPRIRWSIAGAGSSRMVVPNPRTELERGRNRRVEILLTADGDCSGWERDPKSFSKRAAEHYLRNMGAPFRISTITCATPLPDWQCEVIADFGAGSMILNVRLSRTDKLVRVERLPDPNTHHVCFYFYRCLPSGALVFSQGTCPAF